MLRWLCIFAASSVLLSAQPPRGPRPWWDSNVTRSLNLSDTQTKQVYATQREFRGRMFDLSRTVNRAESEVEAAFNEDPVDQRKANEAIDRLASARAELTRAVSQMDLKLRTILTAQQWQDLQKQQHTLPDRGPDRGPGRRRGPVSSTATEGSGSSKQQK